MKSNFEFLTKEFPEYAEMGYLAEKNCYNDPNTSLCKLGMMAESMVAFVCLASDFTDTNLEKSTAEQRINLLKQRRLITDNLCQILHKLRISRNKAIHENYESTEEVLQLLPQAYQFSIWFYNSYGEEHYTPHNYYIPKDNTEVEELSVRQEDLNEKELYELMQKKAEVLKEISDEKRKKKAQLAKIELLTYLAEAEDVEAQEELMDIYLRYPDYYDWELGLKWAKKAAKNYSEEAAAFLYSHYDLHVGEPDYAEAAKWCLPLAKRENPTFMLHLIHCYAMMHKYDDYIKWIRTAADAGVLEAYYMMGEDYESGHHGFFQDYEEAFYWFQRGAKANPIVDGQIMDIIQFKCILKLADYYLNGKGTEQNTEEAIRLYTLLEAASDSPAFKHTYKYDYEKITQDVKEKIGNCYFDGIGVNQNYQKAFEWYQKAAKEGNWSCQKKMNECHFQMTGQKVYYDDALKHMVQEYHDSSFGFSAYYIGEYYYNGDGVPQNYEESVKWFKRAASKNDDQALIKLGDCYFKGIGTQTDYQKAIECYEKVSSYFTYESMEHLAYVYYKMSVQSNNIEYIEKALKYLNDTISEHKKLFNQIYAPRLCKIIANYIYKSKLKTKPEILEEAFKLYRYYAYHNEDNCEDYIYIHIGCTYMDRARQAKKTSTRNDLFRKGEQCLMKAIEMGPYKKERENSVFTMDWEDDVEFEERQYIIYDYYDLWRYMGYCSQYISKDPVKAAIYYKEAMKSPGSVGIDAKLDLAELYYFSHDLEKWQSAFLLFCELLEHKESENYQNCLFYMGECYYNGWGVNKNRWKAKKYYKKAVQEGSVAAKCKLDNWNWIF